MWSALFPNVGVAMPNTIAGPGGACLSPSIDKRSNRVHRRLRPTEVAERFGVARQTVHRWVARYRDSGFDGLADRSHAPKAHPWRVSAEVEAVICDLRGLAPPVEPAPPGLRARQARSPGHLPVHGLPGADPSPADRAGAAAQAPGPVPPVGAIFGDGAVAAGRDGQLVPGRRPGMQDHHRDR